MDQISFLNACKALSLELSALQVQQFVIFEENLYKANEVMNLTRVPREECWLRHFVDSLLIHPLIESESSVLDIGTGAGFPAWPLACSRFDLRVTALDSSHKAIGFLSENLLPNLRLVTDRAEDWKDGPVFQLVTGRALAPMPIHIEVSAPFVQDGGLLVPMRSANEREDFERLADREKELRKLGLELESIQERTLPGTDIVRLFPMLRKKREGKMGRRSWADMKRSPIW